MSHYLIIDGNSLGYTAQDGRKLYVGGVEVQAVYYFARMLRDLLISYRATPIMLWDGKAAWRKALWPDYKANRDVDPVRIRERQAYKQQRPMITEMLNYLGVMQITCFDAEADDVATHLSRIMNRNGHRVTLVSGDKDWVQLVTPNVDWYDKRFDRRCNHQTFQSIAEYATPQQFIQAKALRGDASDNIPGIGGFGPVAIKLLFERYGSVEAFLWETRSDLELSTLPKCFGAFFRNETPKPSKKWGVLSPMREAYDRNLRLMDLSRIPPVTAQNMKKEPGRFDPNAFRRFCEELAFRSILNQFDQWLLPFAA